MSKKLKVLYVEDLKSVREGLNYLLSQYKHLDVIDETFDIQKMPEFLNKHHPDIVILDLQLSLPRSGEQYNGFDICALINQHDPQIKMIAHSMYDNVENVNKFVDRGGRGFVSKKSSHKHLLKAIDELMKDKKFICPEIVKSARNAERFMSGEDDQLKAQHDIFTKAEKSVLEKVSKGYSTKQIADQLKISEKTVETHRKHLFEKAKVKNVAELMAFAYSNRIVME